MKIEFDTDINGYQNARKLMMLVEYYIHSESADPTVLPVIESLQQQLCEFLARPEFRQFHNTEASNKDASPGPHAKSNGLLARISTFLHSMMGPSRREMMLSKQRQELIERAEHAELSAFAALAETAEVGRERDDALQKLKLLETELKKLKEIQ